MITDADKTMAAKFIDPSDGDFAELSGLFEAHRIASTEALIAQLQTVLEREAATTARYDARLAELEGENMRLARAVIELNDNVEDRDGISSETDITVDIAGQALGAKP